jgi:hypothetical protein
MNTRLASAIALAAMSALAAQDAAKQPKFEVASVKRWAGGDIRSAG